jgi:hypothetical protein
MPNQDKLELRLYSKLEIAEMERTAGENFRKENPFPQYKQNLPRRTNTTSELHTINNIDLYEDFELDKLISTLQEQKQQGATHLRLDFAFYDNEIYLNTTDITFLTKSATESDSDFETRAIALYNKDADRTELEIRKRIIQHNKNLQQYLDLKKQYENQ